MYSNKSCPQNECFKSNSFNDRVCDDLCEVILQFLPIEDKFRLEGVSKQFQRTVFERHYKLVIDSIYLRSKRRNLRNFETLLKKLPNIRSLEQNIFSEYSDLFLEDSEIDLIIKYCHNLVKINCDLSHMSEIMRKLLAKKFGLKLLSFTANIDDFKMIRKCFPNIEELQCLSSVNNSFTFKHLSLIGLKKLNKISVEIKYILPEIINEEVIGLQTIADNNQSITHLSITFGLFRVIPNLDLFFKQISRFKNLLHLEIRKQSGIPDNLLINGLTLLSLNCHKLKSLSIDYLLLPEYSPPLLYDLKHFKQLKNLEIGLNFVEFKKFEHIFNKSFKGLENLTHLKIEFPSINSFCVPIDEILLKDIDIHLPKLQYLFIGYQIKVTENTALIVSRLSKLETLNLNVTDKSIADIIDTKVIENCSKIKSIETFKQLINQKSTPVPIETSRGLTTVVSIGQWVDNKIDKFIRRVIYRQNSVN